MRVALAQVDGKWPNLALAKLTAWHRANGDDVTLFSPLAGADRVYAAKVFSDTPDDPYLPADAVRGGSGYDLTTTLPAEVEAVKPDWSLWPWFDKDIGFTTRGCVRRCRFCVVPRKEGSLRIVGDFASASTGRPDLVLLDNNITAAPIEHFRAVCEDATKAGVRLDFSQGLDARLFNEVHAAIIARSRISRRVHMAFDNINDEAAVRRAVSTWKAAGMPASRLTFYVLVGFDTTPGEDMGRIEIVRSLGADPFVMKYRGDNWYYTVLARWVNNKVAFKSMTWPEWLATYRVQVPSRWVTTDLEES